MSSDPIANVRPSEKITSFTGLRGVCALWVLYFHLAIALQFSHYPLEEHLSPFVLRVLFNGYMGVDLFFLMSGFVMSFVYAESFTMNPSKKSLARYYFLRLSRFYPLHILVLLGYLAIKVNGGTFPVETCGNPLAQGFEECFRFSARGFVEQVLLVSSWKWRAHTVWNDVAWSINSEWFAYLCFPFVVRLIARVKRPFSNAAAATASLLAMTLVLWQGHFLNAFNGSDETGLLRISGEFLAGCFCFNFYKTNVYGRIKWSYVGLCSAGLCLLALSSSWVWTSTILFAILLLAVAQPHGALSRALSSKLMVWFGDISFSLYITHLLVMEAIGIVLQDPNAKPLSQMQPREVIGMVAFLTVLSLIVAALGHYYVEKPAQKRLRAFIDRLFPISHFESGLPSVAPVADRKAG